MRVVVEMGVSNGADWTRYSQVFKALRGLAVAYRAGRHQAKLSTMEMPTQRMEFEVDFDTAQALITAVKHALLILAGEKPSDLTSKRVIAIQNLSNSADGIKLAVGGVVCLFDGRLIQRLSWVRTLEKPLENPGPEVRKLVGRVIGWNRGDRTFGFRVADGDLYRVKYFPKLEKTLESSIGDWKRTVRLTLEGTPHFRNPARHVYLAIDAEPGLAED